jgi:regulator of protease activity HflC (stomatin/prohibitin superfamily)
MTQQNEYMQQVMAAQADVEANLKRKMRRPAAMVEQAAPARALVSSVSAVSEGGETPAVDVRITGFWRWKNVIVPPNAYVVHTRRGRREPLHCGLGTSFRFNPLTDSFLVVPAAMQTIIINANCICREKQGILVQGYVQWVVDDFRTAYRKLDFSDPIDPMAVVNIQLREQAEAVIKDTVATMTLESVLADRQPIIRELTDRLRNIMEGEGGGEGLGLRIVTVQIKEAVVSSSSLWETLQRAFRAERRKIARLAELEQEVAIREREAEERKASEVLAIETAAEIARRRAEAEARTFDRQQAEAARRARIEAEALTEALEHEKAKAAKRAELDLLTIENQNRAEALRFQAAAERSRTEIETDAARRAVANDVSPALLQQELIAALPDIVERLPRAEHMKSISINGIDGLSTVLPALAEILERFERPKIAD